MKQLITLLLTINTLSANSQCCEFDKECFAIVIRVLYFANALDKTDDTFKVHLPYEEYKKFFDKKVDVGGKTICLKLVDLERENSKLLIIGNVEEISSSKFKVHFSSRHNASRYMGEVNIGFENGRPIFLDKHFIGPIIE
jgi:hypothetical protein